MPCHAARARQLIRQGKAKKKHDRGLVYLVLVERTEGATQPVALGIDPGSKKEAFVVGSEKHTYLNMQADAVTWAKDHVKTRRQMRRLRRRRHAPHRANRVHRARGGIPPSTRAWWGLKVRLAQWLARYYPIGVIVIEDVAAETRPGKRRWNASFSPLEVGEHRCYKELGKTAGVVLVRGHETKALRDAAGLKKGGAKMPHRWEAHCVDAFVLTRSAVGGPGQPEQRRVLCLMPLQFHRRQLHRLQACKGGVRAPYGGTISMGLKRGSWVKHPKWGLAYVGGTMNGRISLHALETGKRLTQNARAGDCRVLCMASWRIRPATKMKPAKVASAPPLSRSDQPLGLRA